MEIDRQIERKIDRYIEINKETDKESADRERERTREYRRYKNKWGAAEKWERSEERGGQPIVAIYGVIFRALSPGQIWG